MAKWAVITVLLYIILIVVVFLPVIWWLVDFVSCPPTQTQAQTQVKTQTLGSFFAIFRFWQFWLFTAVIILIQAALLFFPVRSQNLEFKPQRAIWLPIVATVFLLSILLLGIGWSVIMAIFGDNGINNFFLWVSLAFLIFSWLVWFGIFFKLSRKTDPMAFSNKLMVWLIKGSILELLIAVPCHIIVRRRNECCAPGITFLGITAGVVIMALAFGPALYPPIKSRLLRMRPKSERT
jgi:hypothetical protein